MMQLARRASLVVVLLLLASVGTASAECAWVLWVYSVTGASPFDAFTSKGDCEAVVSRIMKDDKKAREEGRQEEREHLVNPTCLPDTVDPRGPKAK
jgi:hypothetical protein